MKGVTWGLKDFARLETNVADEQREPLFERFFHEQFEGLYRTMLLLTGDRSEAEDLAQEAMARAFERWSRIQSANDPAAYVYKVAFNLNKRRLRQLRRSIASPEHLEQLADGDPTADVLERAEVSRALASLPRSQLEAVVLVEWVGLTSEEAGKILGIDGASVRGRVHRARALLKARLGGMLDDSA